MNGVMNPGVSAGSNQVGASETWMPQVSCPAGAAAPASRGDAGDQPERGERQQIAAGQLEFRWSRSRFPRAAADDGPHELLRSSGLYDAGLGAVAGDAAQRMSALDRDVLVGRGIGDSRDQPEPGFADPRPDAVDERQLPDRREDRSFS